MTPEQIAEERAKAGLPPLTAPAVPEPVRAEGPDPLLEDLIDNLVDAAIDERDGMPGAVTRLEAARAAIRAALSRTQGVSHGK